MLNEMKKRKNFDLIKIKNAIRNNIELLLDSLNIKYELINGNYFSTCPVHAGSDNKKAISISKDKMVWRCWTRGCQENRGSGIINFVQAVLSSRSNAEVDFNKTLKYICKVYKLNTKDNLVAEEETKPNELYEIVKIFKPQQKLHNDSYVDIINISDSCDYFTSRGFKPETLRHFGVGDCLDNDSIMKNRAIIPIHNESDKIVGYIGRATKPYITPKFLFSRGFKKTDYLYNYNRAIESVSNTSALFLVEGQGDVWRLYECGIKNCVSIFGREISASQKQQILNMNITTLVVLTDDDQSGRESKFQIQRQFSRIFSLKFPILPKKDIGDMKIEQVNSEILTQVKGLY